jgi:aspartate carbamoyltransferase regulatory subunit
MAEILRCRNIRCVNLAENVDCNFADRFADARCVYVA